MLNLVGNNLTQPTYKNQSLRKETVIPENAFILLSQGNLIKYSHIPKRIVIYGILARRDITNWIS